MYLFESTYYDLKQVANISTSLSEQVAKEIGRLIVTGVLSVGSTIESEIALANKFQVSHTVARDALKILARKGLVKLRKKLKTKVTPMSHWHLFDDDVLAWIVTSQPKADFIQKLMEVRFAIEPSAARWAAERGSITEINRIEEAYQNMLKAERSLDDFVVANALFYQSILKASKNEFLATMEGITYSAILVGARLTRELLATNKDYMQEHKLLCEAIVKGDGRQAESFAEQYLQRSTDLILAAVES